MRYSTLLTHKAQGNEDSIIADIQSPETLD